MLSRGLDGKKLVATVVVMRGDSIDIWFWALSHRSQSLKGVA